MIDLIEYNGSLKIKLKMQGIFKEKKVRVQVYPKK